MVSSGIGAEERAGQFVCFVYHRFGDDRYPSTNIGIDAFRGQLEVLRQRQAQVLTLSAALARLDEGTLKEPTVVFTVDDGYASFLSGAMPLLKAFGYPATLFVNTRSVGGRDMLSWDQLRQLAAQGMEIGNHTASHAQFLDLPEADRAAALRADVLEAQEEFTRHLGRAPPVFSYPFGEYDEAMRRTIAQLGPFRAAVAQNSGVVSDRADRFALPRFPMGGPFATVAGFSRKMAMRALPVTAVETLPGEPPALRLHVEAPALRLSGAQCFVAGGRACSLRVDATGDTATVWMQADKALTARRTLYTVTAPAAAGSAWHWFSHVWVRTDIPE